jgi:hypothetical protein
LDQDGFFGEHVAEVYSESSARMFDPAAADVANQGLISHHVRVRNGEVEKSSIPFRDQ